MERDYGEALEKKYAEDALNRKAKAGIQSNNYNCSVKMAKFHIKKESTIKQITCQKCGKIFKTNRDTKLCFSCERKKN
ncbi:hypothetical protein [Methanobacterium aggregans]|uniref:hypothetical protein n=1 Tax=Methanobacterium aggregans TaxID=1615586 RepID=UPI00320E6279